MNMDSNIHEMFFNGYAFIPMLVLHCAFSNFVEAKVSRQKNILTCHLLPLQNASVASNDTSINLY
jgi:hypothetical protein